MVAVIIDTKIEAEIDVDVLIIGGGAAGLTAALAANEAGKTVLIVERESRLSGSTALSSGLIPAAGTTAQASQSISDTADVFYADIMGKNKNKADPDHVRRVVTQIPKTIASRAIILACNGYGGNPDLVAKHIPEMHDALYFGHPHGILVTWAHDDDHDALNMIPRGQGIAESLNTDSAQSMPLQPGQLSLHHTNLIHASFANDRDTRRIGLGISYILTSCKNVGQTPATALLVRGEDKYNSLTAERRLFDAESEEQYAYHRELMTIFRNRQDNGTTQSTGAL